MQRERWHTVVLIAVETLVGRVTEKRGEPIARSVAGQVWRVAHLAVAAELVAFDAGKFLDDHFASGGHVLLEIGNLADGLTSFRSQREGDVVDLLLELGQFGAL